MATHEAARNGERIFALAAAENVISILQGHQQTLATSVLSRGNWWLTSPRLITSGFARWKRSMICPSRSSN